MPNELIVALERGDWKACRSLIHTTPLLLHGKNKSGYTALMLLAMAPCEAPEPNSAVMDVNLYVDDRASYWKQRNAVQRERKFELHMELFEIMLSNGAASTAAIRTNHMAAADWAAKTGKTEWATRLKGLECPDPDCTCALCGEYVERRNQAVKVSERVACGLEVNPSVRSFFLDEVWAGARQTLMTPHFHALTHSHFPLCKELSESMAIMRVLATHLETANASDRAVHLIDLCSGKSLTSAIGALRFPGCVVTAVDLMPSKMLPHYAEAGLNVMHLQLDMLAKDFTSKLASRAAEVNLPVMVLGVHCCGFLSLAAVDAFKVINLAEIVLLMPCCLPAKRDPRTPPRVYEARDNATQYLRWCEHLRDALGPEATLDFNADDVLSVKAAVIKASRQHASSVQLDGQ